MVDRMQWDKLLDTSIFMDPESVEDPERPNYARDYDRLVFSAPFRRLANKTQVHPLYSDDHLHHRLIHSIEVSSVGRSLGIRVANWLKQRREISDYQCNALPGVVQAACIAHDIGNPPFGHSGEEAIGEWFKNKFHDGKGIFENFDECVRAELEAFEGNAQGFRLIAKLELYRNNGGMRLSNATLAAFMKYPVTALVSQTLKNREGKPSRIELKKYGVFASELDLFREVAKTAGLKEICVGGHTIWCRHPLVFLVEAADDICYNIIDLEDAFIAGEISKKEIIDLLTPLAGSSSRTFDSDLDEVGYFRARAIGASIDGCVDAFRRNYESIMSGSLTTDLVGIASIAEPFRDIKDFSKSKIFNAPRKTRLEVSGRNTIHGVLEGILPLIEELESCSWDRDKLSGYFRQLESASQIDLRNISSTSDALHALADYVSGMTDRFAVKMHRTLSGDLE